MSDSFLTNSSYVSTETNHFRSNQSFYNDSLLDNNNTDAPVVIRQGGGYDETHMTLEAFKLARRVLRLHVNLILGVFGALTNVASLVVLKRDGVWKSSNILLMALAVADLVFTASKTDIAGIIYMFSEKFGFHYSHDINVFLFYGFVIAYSGSNTSYFLSITIPLLIIVERVIAIFLPLRFASIVTPKRTLLVCIAVYAIVIIRCIPIFFELSYYTSNGILYLSYTPMAYGKVYNDLVSVTNYITGLGYLSFVIIGTFVIGAKVKHVSNQRKKLAIGSNATESKKGTSRTTKTLLSVCVIYCVTNSLIYIFDAVRNYYMNTPFGAFFYELNETLSIINSSCNFFVYVYYNKKFRNHLSFRGSQKSAARGKI